MIIYQESIKSYYYGIVGFIKTKITNFSKNQNDEYSWFICIRWQNYILRRPPGTLRGLDLVSGLARLRTFKKSAVLARIREWM